MDSSRRKCFDYKHYIDVAVAVDTVDGVAIESKFGFYHRFVVAAAAAVGRKSTVNRSIDWTGSIHVADKLARCVIYRSRFAFVVTASVGVGVASDFETYLALCEQLAALRVQRSLVGDLKRVV